MQVCLIFILFLGAIVFTCLYDETGCSLFLLLGIVAVIISFALIVSQVAKIQHVAASQVTETAHVMEAYTDVCD